MVPDRRFNTASLMQTYLGAGLEDTQQRIEWQLNDPNLLQMALPGGLQVGGVRGPRWWGSRSSGPPGLVIPFVR